ncbi:MAG: hypothetical protein WCE90_12340, partial [Candidatus Zixiibacteriota bacterium]
VFPQPLCQKTPGCFLLSNNEMKGFYVHLHQYNWCQMFYNHLNLYFPQVISYNNFVQSETEKSTWGFVKKVAVLVGVLSAAVVIVFTIIGYIDSQFKRGWEIGAIQERLTNSEVTIQNKDKEIQEGRSANDSLRRELDQYRSTLDSVLDSKIVVSDTIIYWQDAIALFGGQLTIQCDDVDTTAVYWNARISGRIYEGGKPKFIDLNASVGDQTPFDLAGSKYLLVLLGCRRYERGPGVKIAVYKQ